MTKKNDLYSNSYNHNNYANQNIKTLDEIKQEAEKWKQKRIMLENKIDEYESMLGDDRDINATVSKKINNFQKEYINLYGEYYETKLVKEKNKEKKIKREKISNIGVGIISIIGVLAFIVGIVANLFITIV